MSIYNGVVTDPYHMVAALMKDANNTNARLVARTDSIEPI